MLRKYVYLDKTTLAEYIATLEGGLIAETKTRSKRAASKGGKVNLKVAEAALQGGNEDEHQWTVSDSPEAQMERLLDAANDDPETIGWIDVMDPDTDFSKAQVGEFISWECDMFVPDLSRTLSPEGDTAKQLKLATGVLSALSAGKFFKIGGIDPATTDPDQIEDMKAQVTAMDEMLTDFKTKRSVVGEDADTAWRVFGTMEQEHLRADDIDDERLIVVGKIKYRLAEQRWRRFTAMVNFETVNRAERRRREKEPPPVGKDEEYIAGPALELDLLAIYR